MNSINGISGKAFLNAEPLHEQIQRRNPEFAKRMEEAIKDVNTNQQNADMAIEKVIKGEMGIHEGMMALGKAETSLKVLAQVRNKVMTAYNEVMRMQV